MPTSRFYLSSFLFFAIRGRHGDEMFISGGFAWGVNDIEHPLVDFFVSLFMPECYSSLDGEVSGRRRCTSECANPRSHERDKARVGGL